MRTCVFTYLSPSPHRRSGGISQSSAARARSAPSWACWRSAYGAILRGPRARGFTARRSTGPSGSLRVSDCLWPAPLGPTRPLIPPRRRPRTAYVNEVKTSLDFVRESTQISLEEKKKFYHTINRNYGSSALCLSGGASFGYYHFGVIKACLDADLLPRVITGTSAGGLVAAFTCTRTDEELKELMTPELADHLTACEESITWVPCISCREGICAADSSFRCPVSGQNASSRRARASTRLCGLARRISGQGDPSRSARRTSAPGVH